jgi:hypothetical protein
VCVFGFWRGFRDRLLASRAALAAFHASSP